MISSVAAIMPGAHADDNGPIASGKIIETTPAVAGGGGAPIAVDIAAILAGEGTSRLGDNLGLTGLDTLIIDDL